MIIMIEKKVNSYGQHQIINNLDAIVKIEGKFLQVRLIRTEKWKDRSQLTQPMPRARFINPDDVKGKIYYLVDSKDLIQLRKDAKKSG